MGDIPKIPEKQIGFKYHRTAHKKYVALLSQPVTGVPVSTVLENTLGGVPTWTRIGVGEYRLTLIGSFTTNKTVLFAHQGPTVPLILIKLQAEPSEDYIYMKVYDIAGNLFDGGLSPKISMIEIRVYD
jgi:hypothetical protein